ncbi:MAG: glutamine-synthetase adenylyltransferase [Pseudomonadota bacterium]
MTTSLTSRLTRIPRVFDADRGADAEGLAAPLPAGLRPLAIGAASCAPYLMALLGKEAAWLAQAEGDPARAIADVLSEVATASERDIWQVLRQGKRRIALLCALADLGGAWALEEVTATLSRFADAACDAALRASLAPLIRRGKMPGLDESALDTAGGMVVLAMGKMGAGELNYSSDIDLICLFDESRFDPSDFHAARAGFVKATRQMCAVLSDITGEGYVFRTDLRLRPDPAVTPVCMSMEAAERYYESLGRTWERAAYIKARPCAGDLAAGERFIKALRPFVWRRHLDFAAIQDAHDMRLAIREHKGLFGPITLPGHDLKLGRGGIREIEFFTQTRQLIAGGRDPELRLRGTVEGLNKLAKKGWVPEETAAKLGAHYRLLRTVEHRLQMVRDGQTHSLPNRPEGFARLAAMMDIDTAALERDLRHRLGEVHGLTDTFFAAPRKAPAADAPFDDGGISDRWPSYPALRSHRGAALFERLKPDLLARLSKAAQPEEAVRAFDGFLSGLPAGVQVFSLLENNPHLLDLLIDVVTTSPALGRYLCRNAAVLDAVIAGEFFGDWPGADGLTEALTALLAAETSYETQLDATRRWAREWHFRIGVHLLRGLIDGRVAGAQYADLAHAVLSALWPVVISQFAMRHGPPPGRGAVILGMGSLGAGRLTATSDLDLLVIYDPLKEESSAGPRPLPSRVYYARLTQAMITAMSAPMAQGKLYEIDMRLRPSGNQGPVATSLASFASYQKSEAWVWEHLALSRAHVVAGPASLADDVTTLCAEVIAAPSDAANVLTQVRQMRARIAAAKAPVSLWDAKLGPGRLQDIELIAQAGALSAGIMARDVADGLKAGAAQGLWTGPVAATLKQAYEACWQLQCAVRLLSSDPIKTEGLGQAGADFLARAVDQVTLDAAALAMQETYDTAARHIDAALDISGLRT